MANSASEASSPTRKSRVILFSAVALVALVIDLVTKAWAWNSLRELPGRAIWVWEPHFEFAFTMNTGSAFGMLQGVSWARAFFIIVTIAALAYMLFLVAKVPTKSPWSFVALGLIASGSIGNLHDRIVRVDELGRYGVVDFLKVNYPWGGSWPTFNVADSAIVVGAAMMFLWLRQDEAALEGSPEPAPAPAPENDSDAARAR